MKKKISFPSSWEERIKLLFIAGVVILLGMYFIYQLSMSVRYLETPGFEKSKELLNSKEDIWNFQK